MSRRVTQGGIILAVCGILLGVAGFGLFISVFITFLRGMSSPLGPSSFHHNPAGFFGRAVIGAVLFGVGGILVKLGIGVGIIGSADRIVGWWNRVDNSTFQNRHSEANESFYPNRYCPSCNASLSQDAVYCHKCGAKTGNQK